VIVCVLPVIFDIMYIVLKDINLSFAAGYSENHGCCKWYISLISSIWSRS